MEDFTDMLSKRIWICVAALALLAASAGIATAQLNSEQQLGKYLFFDKQLSTPPGQACAACHGPEVGYTGPDSNINAHGAVYEGAVTGRFGNRKPPASAYAGNSPIILYQDSNNAWIGGMFWDGRATGWTLDDPLAEQAQGPFLNPLEQNNPNAKKVVDKVLKSDYKDLFNEVCTDSTKYYECIARSIAAYERSPEVSSFTSKYDAVQAGEATFTTEEENGLTLFVGKANCDNCHTPPLFTDFTYDNLGVPKNPENPFYTMPPKWNRDGKNFIDYGLGGFLKNAGYGQDVYMPELGKMKVPTLRNVDKRPDQGFVKAFSHNGYFKSLESIVHFYNTRDLLHTCGGQYISPGVDCWPAPEVNQNVNDEEVGNLGLTTTEEADIVAFLKTLSDE
jgi:cytochrome c peroxidase